MKRLSKCLACKKVAKENHRIHKISEGYMYQLLRENCTHTEEQQKGVDTKS